MLSKEEYGKLVDGLKESLDETTVALISESLLNLLSVYNNSFDEYEKLVEEMKKLKDDKEELLKVNGRLYQKIGFDEVEEEKEKVEDNEEIKIEDVINEKGEII